MRENLRESWSSHEVLDLSAGLTPSGFRPIAGYRRSGGPTSNSEPGWTLSFHSQPLFPLPLYSHTPAYPTLHKKSSRIHTIQDSLLKLNFMGSGLFLSLSPVSYAPVLVSQLLCFNDIILGWHTAQQVPRHDLHILTDPLQISKNLFLTPYVSTPNRALLTRIQGMVLTYFETL